MTDSTISKVVFICIFYPLFTKCVDIPSWVFSDFSTKRTNSKIFTVVENTEQNKLMTSNMNQTATQITVATSSSDYLPLQNAKQSNRLADSKYLTSPGDVTNPHVVFSAQKLINSGINGYTPNLMIKDDVLLPRNVHTFSFSSDLTTRSNIPVNRQKNRQSVIQVNEPQKSDSMSVTLSPFQMFSRNLKQSSKNINNNGITWKPFPVSGIFGHLEKNSEKLLNGSENIGLTEKISHSSPLKFKSGAIPLDNVRDRTTSTKVKSKSRIFNNNILSVSEGHNYNNGITTNVENSNRQLPPNIINPESFRVSHRDSDIFQPPLGGRCFTDFESMAQGVCVQLKDCPFLQSVADQLQYIPSRIYLFNTVCRFENGKAFFCCPLYTLSQRLPAQLNSIVTPVERSPHPAPIPTPDECGNVNIRKGRIIGGIVLQDGEWPWLVSLGSTGNMTEFKSVCSGSLITRRHVLTAAHCFHSPTRLLPTLVRAGETDLSSRAVPRHREYIIVSYTAPLFHYYYAINDVAIVTLDRDVVFDDFVQPGCLPFSRPDSPKPGDNVTSVGYGFIEDNELFSVISPHPNSIVTEVHENSFCQQAYYGAVAFYIVDDRTFCEGGEAGMSTCRGDSGGPVHLWDQSLQRHLIVGIVNAGKGCGEQDSPSVDLRVGAFLPWIQSVVGG
uniref:Serine protease 33-like n=1 Tax=Hirondellea gigas TaxID=1518452 RepID=A0A6A7G4H2_9CRUS